MLFFLLLTSLTTPESMSWNLRIAVESEGSLVWASEKYASQAECEEDRVRLLLLAPVPVADAYCERDPATA